MGEPAGSRNQRSPMSEKVVVHAVGDIGLHGSVGKMIRQRGPGYPFELVTPVLDRSDILLGNLEIPFVEGGSSPVFRDVSPEFRAAPEAAAALSHAGFNVVTLANNHMMDFGAGGLRTTMAALESEGIAYAGAGENIEEARRPVVVERGGMRIGLIARAVGRRHAAGPASPGVAPLDESEILESVKRLSDENDALVVSLHFGMIYTDYPRIEDRDLARRIIGAGAAAVIGHHPHLIQGIESYSGRVIAYSLGEFIFDPSAGIVEAVHVAQLRRQRLMLEIVFEGKEVRADPIPVYAGEDCRPVPCEDRTGSEILERLGDISRALLEYDIDFQEHLASRTVSHEMRVAMANLRRGNPLYLVRKLLSIRPRHAAALISEFRRRISGKAAGR